MPVAMMVKQIENYPVEDRVMMADAIIASLNGVRPEYEEAWADVAKGALEIPGAKVICLLPFGLKGYKPHGVAVRRLAESKTLVLSGFPESVPATPINYENCHLNNDWARLIAGAGGDKSPKS